MADVRRSRLNYLRRVVAIQNITLAYTQKGISQEVVYRTVIYPQFFISRSTYYSYLACPAKRELRQLTENFGL